MNVNAPEVAAQQAQARARSVFGKPFLGGSSLVLAAYLFPLALLSTNSCSTRSPEGRMGSKGETWPERLEREQRLMKSNSDNAHRAVTQLAALFCQARADVGKALARNPTIGLQYSNFKVGKDDAIAIANSVFAYAGKRVVLSLGPEEAAEGVTIKMNVTEEPTGTILRVTKRPLSQGSCSLSFQLPFNSPAIDKASLGPDYSLTSSLRSGPYYYFGDALEMFTVRWRETALSVSEDSLTSGWGPSYRSSISIRCSVGFERVMVKSVALLFGAPPPYAQ